MSHVLVVDDESIARESLARLLTSGGHAVVTAANGRDAWLTLYEGVPDLILLDLMMPQMDGVTFLTLLRRSDHWSRVPVIVVTGLSADEGMVREARKLGVADVLSKAGCGVERLLSLVKRTLTEASESPPLNLGADRARRSRHRLRSMGTAGGISLSCDAPRSRARHGRPTASR
jgi:CheY-like chemotaxis protein